TAVAELGRRGLTAKRVPVACAFHSPLVAPAADALATELACRDITAAALPVWSNSTAAPYPTGPDEVRASLARQVAEPVRFVEQVEAMYEAGARVFIEAGPGRVLTHLVGRILGQRPHTAVACDVPGESGLSRLLHTLAELAAAQVPIDLAPLFVGRAAPVPADNVPSRPAWVVDGQLVRSRDGESLPGGLRPATAAPTAALAAESATEPAAGPPT